MSIEAVALVGHYDERTRREILRDAGVALAAIAMYREARTVTKAEGATVIKVHTNDGRVHIAEPAHVNSSPAGQLTDALAKEWAQATDFITVNPGKLQGKEAIVAASSIVGIYTKADHDQRSTLPEAEYSHKIGGSRRFNKTWGVYIMQPDSAWRKRHQDELVALKSKYPWCSVFFKDSAGTYSYTAAGTPAKPPGFTVNYKVGEWIPLLSTSFNAWDAAVGYQYAMLNGLQPETVNVYTPAIGMIEAAFGPLDHVLPSEADWKTLANQTWDAQAKGWTPWLYVKMNTTYDSAEWKAFRNLSLPTALLLDQGSLLYCIGGKEGTAPGWSTGEYRHAGYNPDIGQPTGHTTVLNDLLDPSGAYVKMYDRGAVIVNPTLNGVSVDLPDGSTHAVDRQSGVILRTHLVYDLVE